MAKIRNTGIPNVFGDGYEQEVELDNGKKYRVRNSGVPNVFGDGYEKEVEEIDISKNSLPLTKEGLLAYLFIGLLCGGLFITFVGLIELFVKPFIGILLIAGGVLAILSTILYSKD